MATHNFRLQQLLRTYCFTTITRLLRTLWYYYSFYYYCFAESSADLDNLPVLLSETFCCYVSILNWITWNPLQLNGN